MTRLATEGTREGVRLGTFRYMQPSAESSLYRNGKVLSRRDRDGSDSGLLGVDLEDREMAILDARTVTQAEQPTLSANGFELLERPSADPDLDFLDHDAVARAYYPECAEIVRAATGAATVAAFDHNVRSATGKSGKRRIAGGQQVQGPAHLVHGDYTLTSAPQRMRDLARPPTLNDTYRTVLAEGETLLDSAAVEQAITDGRFALINVWRNIAREPVATRPLALCDGMSVHPDRARRLRNPLQRPDRRELLRQARRPSPLGLLVRHDPRRGAAHQAVGFGRRAGPVRRHEGRP